MIKQKGSTEVSSNNRMLWLDGLRGVACILVFLHHFMLGLFPASYFGTTAESKIRWGIDIYFSYKPFGVIINGNFWTCVFLLISAYLMAAKVMRAKQKNTLEVVLRKSLVQRYPRLAIPVGVVGVFFFFFIKVLDKVGLNYRQTVIPMNFKQYLYTCFIGQWLHTDSSIQGPFWMLHVLFFGSILALLVALVSNADRFRWYIYLILLYPVFLFDAYYIASILGVLLADMVVYKRFAKLRTQLEDNKKLRNILGYIIVIIGLWFGGYPSGVPAIGSYTVLGIMARNMPNGNALWHCIGAFVLMCGLFVIPRNNHFILANKWVVKMGGISFSIYLLHMILINSWGYHLFGELHKVIKSYTLTGGITFVILFVVLIIISFIFDKFIEKPCFKLCHRIG